MIPTDKKALEAAGYVYDNDGICRGCGLPIEWWITPARPGKPSRKMPMRVLEIRKDPNNACSPAIGFARVPHFADCEQADRFRR